MKETDNDENLPAVNNTREVGDTDKNSKFFSFPNSPASNTMFNVVSHAGNLETFANRLEQNSHSSQLDFFTPPEGTTKELSQRVKYTTDNTETVIHLDNVDFFTKANKPLKKILTYTLINLSRKNISENLIQDISIKFPLTDFVELGSYKTLRSARQAFNEAKGPLTSIKIEGVVRDKKDMKQITDTGIEVLFTGAHVKNGIAEIFLNRRINWELFALQYFSIIPKTYFSLSDNAADILLNTFMLARKRLNDIDKKQSFNISFKTLQQILDLPDENQTKNPGRDIREPILNALNEVTKAENGDLVITPVYNVNANIIEFLEEGYANIQLHNEYLEYFESLAHTKRTKIEATQKMRAEIAEKAKVKALSKKIEQDESSKKGKKKE
ncbi:MAG: hypothetical protein MJ181_11715 [Treponema sp.]|nr:hypothetical protein [Treponema sp.]